MELNKLFSNGMVLQANKPIRIFGTGIGTARVEIDGLVDTITSSDEEWLLEMPSHNYGGPYTLKVFLNENEKLIEDVYFGDVYLLAGQSNIEYRGWQTKNPEEEYENNDLVRAFFTKIECERYEYPVEEKWLRARGCMTQWSALGWPIANKLQKEGGHAVGIIPCYRGASRIESWLPKDILKDTEFEIATEEMTGHLRKQEYINWNHDGFLYEGKLKKIIPFPMKAVVWYQGESNCEPIEVSKIYKDLLNILINYWRKEFKDEELPFIVVQIHDYINASNSKGWKLIQEAQVDIANEMENVHTVISADICEDNNIHPPTKLPLAIRIKEKLQEV